MQQEGPVQRLRLVFTRGSEIQYISHLDIMRMWERVLRRARVPLAYSHGFNPQPRIALAAPLPVGVTSEGELMDVFLVESVPRREFLERVEPQLPAGVRVLDIDEVSISEPSLQSRVRFADYQVTVKSKLSRDEVEDRIRRLLSAKEVFRERRRDTRVRRYDLRPFIKSLAITAWNTEQCLEMRLVNSPSGAARPDEVLAELGLEH
ncbi:MAG: TIGR03936 family radical SAM-associated protein, partial [Chloroflexota bacterium]